MFGLGLFISLASIPGWTSVTIPAGWAALSIVLPWTLWRRAQVTVLHSFFWAFGAYAALSLLWVHDFPNAIWRLWGIAIMLAAIHLGSALDDLEDLWLGLGWGMAGSSLLAVAQWFGFPFIMNFNEFSPAGLHYNPSVHGMILALVGIALWAHQRYWLTLALLPGLYLSHSRGAYAVFVCGLLLTWFRIPLLALALGLGAMFYATLGWSPNDLERLAVWAGTNSLLKPLGLGAGSLTDLFVAYNGRIVQPEYSHNDYLQLLFEFGIGALFFFAAIGLALARDFRSWPVLAAAFIFAFITFPLFHPISLFIFAIAAGSACRSWPDLWTSYNHCRRSLLSRLRRGPKGHCGASGEALPIQLPHPKP